MSQTDTSAQLIKPKQFSIRVAALIWFLLFGVGLLIYIFYYVGKRDGPGMYLWSSRAIAWFNDRFGLGPFISSDGRSRLAGADLRVRPVSPPRFRPGATHPFDISLPSRTIAPD